MIHMKCQGLFSQKKWKKKDRMLSAATRTSALKVNFKVFNKHIKTVKTACLS